MREKNFLSVEIGSHTNLENEKAYIDSVLKYFEEVYPEDSSDTKPALTTDPTSLALERSIEAEFTEVLLNKYGVPKGVINEIVEGEDSEIQVWKLPKPENFSVPDLASSYAFSGGVARAGLLRALHINPRAGYRDIDIIRFGGELSKSPEELQLELEHMPEDSSHGYGVQRYEDPNTYLATRDLTISEIYMDKNNLVFTPQCLLDTVRRIVRLSEFEREELKSDRPKTKILAKAVRILAQGIVEFGDFYMDKEISKVINENYITFFYQALHFVRSLEHSEEAAYEYLNILKQHDSVPEEIETLDDFTAYLAARLRDRSVFFREAPVMQRWFEDNLLAEASVNIEKKLAGKHGDRISYGEALANNEIGYSTALNEAKQHLRLNNTEIKPKSNGKVTDNDDEYENMFLGDRKRYKLK